MRLSSYLSSVGAVMATAALVRAEDHLVSRRFQKRGLDAAGNYNISIYHINDVHAHLDEFRSSGTDCTDPGRGCYGGYARVKTVLDKERPGKEDSLLLNAGDEFQGTLFYTFYKGEKIAETLNQLGFDAMTVGNHEFDAGDDVLADFLGNLTFPIVSSNIKTTHPKLKSNLVPYHIFPQHKLAIVSATTETTPDISNPGDNTLFEDPVTSIQRTVDLLRETEDITRIIALTHIGYDKDIELAKKTTGISLIIGGHSHTPLGDFDGAEGKYPTIATNPDGDEVFVVTAYRWGEYLGYIDVAYDPSGKIVSYNGAPIHLTNATAQDADLQAQIDEWRVPFEEFAAEVLGESSVTLEQETCQQEECTLGNYMTDAMLAYRQDANPGIAFALINAGGIRATIDVGPITRGEVLTSFPFGNSIVELTFSGADLWKAVEGILTGVSQFNQREVTSFFQVSKGVEISYNPTNPNNTRLISFHINDEPLDMEKEYQFVTLDFLAGGGDNFWETQSDFVTLDTQDEVLVQYIEQTSPVSIEIEGRIKITEETVPGNGEGGGEGPTVPPPGNGTNTTNPPPVPGPGEGESTASVLSASSALGAVVIAAVVGVFGWAL